MKARSSYPRWFPHLAAVVSASCRFTAEGTLPTDPPATPSEFADAAVEAEPPLAPVTPISLPSPDASPDASWAADTVAPATDAAPGDAALPDDDGGASASKAAVCPPGPALRLCLRFEGATIDESSGAHDAVAEQVGYEAGPTGQAARVGGQIRIESGLQFAAGPFTFEARVRLDEIPGAGRVGVIDKAGRYALHVVPGGGVACLARGAMALAPQALKPGTWRTLACTVADDGVLSVWVDGARKAETPTRPAPPPAADEPLFIGGTAAPAEVLRGLVDDVRIWTQVRTAAQLCDRALGCPDDGEQSVQR